MMSEPTLEERARRERTLAALARAVEGCRRCEIGSLRTKSVFGDGDPCARLMCVGEGPGETEDRTGHPFVGRAGELLTKMLAAIGLERDEVYICNTVKCRACYREGAKLRNRAPTPEELANCRPYLDEQIALIRPKVILALGAPAAKSFLGPAFQITKMRGRWYEGPHGIPLMVTFHPAYVLRQTGGSEREVKRLVWDDLKAAKARLDDIERASALPSEAPPAPPDSAPAQTTLF
ncbi:MAG TPA: uracil-DNA glycosylase [Candidatus Dormibacteraeota bacterium]|nr:uracil-DNA glycosylase [Candidatus Dormibacteraeota bacterium]